MRFETVRDVKLPKVGYGTWKIGGEALAEPEKDEISMAALRSALELGYTHFDTAECYAAGHAEELLGEAIRESRVEREQLFITSKVSPDHFNQSDVLKSCENSLKRLGLEYIDLYLMHWPNPKIKQEETFESLNKLVRAGKVRNLGVSNFNLKQLKKACDCSETPIITNQVPYRLPDRRYVDNGVLGYCQQNDIIVTGYTPVKFRNLKVNQEIKTIAEAHQATVFQIALAWLINQPRVITIPMSLNPAHQKENLEAAEIVLSSEEMSQLNQLYS